MQSIGTGGALVFAPSGTLLAAGAFYYGYHADTNNTVEGRAMVDCLKMVAGIEWQREYSGVMVHGDISLIISFMQRCACPGKAELVTAVQEARGLV